MIAGLTGGIGSGKSVVSRLFEMLGCAVFQSDTAAKQAYSLNEIKKQVVALLGEEAYGENNQINRKYISASVFNDQQLLQRLNAIIHPAVGTMFRKFANENSHKVIIKESALLFEANVTAGLDKIIAVVSPDEERIKRIMHRDGITRQETLRRFGSQMPQEEKARRADFVIHNDEKHLLITQAERIFTILSQA